VENTRLSQPFNDKNWKVWGPYLSERQWGTVREDYSPSGNTWSYINHDLEGFAILSRYCAWRQPFGMVKTLY